MPQAAFGVALQQAAELGMEPVWRRLQQLAALLRGGLAQIPGVTVRDRGRCLCAIVSFTKVAHPIKGLRFVVEHLNLAPYGQNLDCGKLGLVCVGLGFRAGVRV